MRASLAVAAAMLACVDTPAVAFDCGKAATTVEKAICADPDLKALDDRLEELYVEVKGLTPEADRKMLGRAQKAWVGAREKGCPVAEAGLSACIADMTATRVALFEGRAETGPGAAGRIIPTFIVQEGNENRYDLDVTMLRFGSPATKGEQLFNAVADAIAARVKVGPHGEDTAGHIYALEEAMTLSYASPSLISVNHSFWSDEGGAHGNGGVANTNIDMKAGKVLEIGDLFEEAAVIGFIKDCKAQIIAQKRERLSGEPYDPATDSFLQDAVIGEHVATLSRWSIRESEASVSFDAYAIGSYAEGSYDCTYAMNELKPLARPGAPLP